MSTRLVVTTVLIALAVAAVLWFQHSQRRAPAGASRPAGADPSTHRAYLDSLRSGAVHLVPAAQPGFSRIGGLPVAPPGFEWPTWKGRPLSFLCQIDLAALPSDAELGALPRLGFLYFFYSAEQETWGFDPNDRGSWRVFYLDKLENARETAAPPGLPEEGVYPAVPVTFRSVKTYPDGQDERVASLNLDDDGYDELVTAVFEGKPEHHLLGHPGPIQGNDMGLECQLTSHGVNTGDASGYSSPQAAALEKGRSDWLLLFQLDSDDAARMMWGDVGRLYFWITRQDLERRDFSKVWMILQCS